MDATVKDNIKERFEVVKKFASLFRLTPKLDNNDDRLDITLFGKDGKELEKKDFTCLSNEREWHSGHTISDNLTIEQSQEVCEEGRVKDHIALIQKFKLIENRYQGFNIETYDGHVVGLDAGINYSDFETHLYIRMALDSERIEKITASIKYYPRGEFLHYLGKSSEKNRYIFYEDDGQGSPRLSVIEGIDFNNEKKKNLCKHTEITDADGRELFSRELQKTLMSIENAVDIATPGTKKTIRELLPRYATFAYGRFTLFRRGVAEKNKLLDFKPPRKCQLKRLIKTPEFLRTKQNRKDAA